MMYWNSLSLDNNKCRILVSMTMNFVCVNGDVLDYKRISEILSTDYAVVITSVWETAASVGPIFIRSLKR
jgi:hypothetical protein